MQLTRALIQGVLDGLGNLKGKDYSEKGFPFPKPVVQGLVQAIRKADRDPARLAQQEESIRDAAVWFARNGRLPRPLAQSVLAAPVPVSAVPERDPGPPQKYTWVVESLPDPLPRSSSAAVSLAPAFAAGKKEERWAPALLSAGPFKFSVNPMDSECPIIRVNPDGSFGNLMQLFRLSQVGSRSVYVPLGDLPEVARKKIIQTARVGTFQGRPASEYYDLWLRSGISGILLIVNREGEGFAGTLTYSDTPSNRNFFGTIPELKAQSAAVPIPPPFPMGEREVHVLARSEGTPDIFTAGPFLVGTHGEFCTIACDRGGILSETAQLFHFPGPRRVYVPLGEMPEALRDRLMTFAAATRTKEGETLADVYGRWQEADLKGIRLTLNEEGGGVLVYTRLPSNERFFRGVPGPISEVPVGSGKEPDPANREEIQPSLPPEIPSPQIQVSNPPIPSPVLSGPSGPSPKPSAKAPPLPVSPSPPRPVLVRPSPVGDPVDLAAAVEEATVRVRALLGEATPLWQVTCEVLALADDLPDNVFVKQDKTILLGFKRSLLGTVEKLYRAGSYDALDRLADIMVHALDLPSACRSWVIGQYFTGLLLPATQKDLVQLNAYHCLSFYFRRGDLPQLRGLLLAMTQPQRCGPLTLSAVASWQKSSAPNRSMSAVTADYLRAREAMRWHPKLKEALAKPTHSRRIDSFPEGAAKRLSEIVPEEAAKSRAPSETVEKRSPGRPKKTSSAPSAPEAPKKRGRPPKNREGEPKAAADALILGLSRYTTTGTGNLNFQRLRFSTPAAEADVLFQNTPMHPEDGNLALAEDWESNEAGVSELNGELDREASDILEADGVLSPRAPALFSNNFRAFLRR